MFPGLRVDAEGSVVLPRKLRWSEVVGFLLKFPPLVIGMEACDVAHWARELGALGHLVRLIPPAYVKPFVKRQKNDAADAEAISGVSFAGSLTFGDRPHMPLNFHPAAISSRVVCAAPVPRQSSHRQSRPSRR
jgi:hypothetical protein